MIELLKDFLLKKGIKEQDMDVTVPEISHSYDEKDFYIANESGSYDYDIGFYEDGLISLNVNAIISGEYDLSWDQVLIHEMCHHVLANAGLTDEAEEELCMEAETLVE